MSLPAKHSPHLAFATLCGLFSAFGYTAANVCLRAVTNCDPIWVSAIKAFPTMLLVGPWLIVRMRRGESVLPEAKVFGILLAGSLIGQLGGNVLFQWSLGVVGIALAVPLTLGTIILSGALLGRFLLHEPLTLRMAASVLTLIVAISVLSLGAREAHRSVVVGGAIVASDDAWMIAAGVSAAALSGLAYSILGVVLRYGVNGRVSLSTTLFTVSLVGVISLGGWSQVRIGWDGMWQTTPRDFWMMVLAGIWNAVAFVALTKALQVTNLVYVNALGATQATMAAVAGVLFFSEALTGALAWGVVLTIVGLVLMKQGTRFSHPSSRGGDADRGLA
jgi:drug/metabolite transporter (DMT)-like permease